MGAEAQALEPSSAASPDLYQGAGAGVGQLRRGWHHLGCQCCQWWSCLLYHSMVLLRAVIAVRSLRPRGASPPWSKGPRPVSTVPQAPPSWNPHCTPSAGPAEALTLGSCAEQWQPQCVTEPGPRTSSMPLQEGVRSTVQGQADSLHRCWSWASLGDHAQDSGRSRERLQKVRAAGAGRGCQV